MTCEKAGQLLPLLLYSELSFEEEEGVETHLDQCAACRSQFGRLKSLWSALDDREIEPQLAQLTANRRRLRNLLIAQEATRSRGLAGWIAEIVNGLDWHPARSLTALVLVAIGFFGAHLIPADPPASMLEGSGPVVSRVRYVEPSSPSGRVQIGIEETRQRVISGDSNDVQMQRLLLSAVKDESDPGLRVDSVNALRSSIASREVRGALLASLRTDPNPGVRLRALDALRSWSSDPETRSVLKQVLLTDDFPGVRTQAIDLLTQRSEPGMVGILQELMQKEDNNYVRGRCVKVLHSMKASAEMY